MDRRRTGAFDNHLRMVYDISGINRDPNDTRISFLLVVWIVLGEILRTKHFDLQHR